LVVIVDQAITLPNRLCCLYELQKAQELLKPLFMWPHRRADLVRLQQSMAKLDIAAATTTETQHAIAIRELLERGLDCDEVATVMNGLGAFLNQRILVYSMSLDQSVNHEELSVLNPQKMRRFHIEHERMSTVEEIDKRHKAHLHQRDMDNANLAVALRSDQNNFAVREIGHEERLDALQEEYKSSIELQHEDHSEKISAIKTQHEMLSHSHDEELRKNLMLATKLEEQQTQFAVEHQQAEVAWAEAEAEAELAHTEVSTVKQEKSRRAKLQRVRDELQQRGNELAAEAETGRTALELEEAMRHKLGSEIGEQKACVAQRSDELQAARIEYNEMRIQFEEQFAIAKSVTAEIEEVRMSEEAAAEASAVRQSEVPVKQEEEEEASEKSSSQQYPRSGSVHAGVLRMLPGTNGGTLGKIGIGGGMFGR